MLKKIVDFYQQHLGNEDKIILISLLVSASIGVIYILINAFSTQYSGNQFVNWFFFLGFPVMAALYSVALFAKDMSPRMGLLTWTYTTFFFMLLALGTLAYGCQFTPFHPIDPLLIKLDQSLAFNQIALLNWTYAHHTIAVWFDRVYSTIGYQISFIPLILALLLDKRAVKVLFMGIIFSFIAGTMMYYFFPTTAPASMFLDPNFAQQQHDTFTKFFEIHHHLPITTDEGGLIAFPSFHVIWAVLLTYALRRQKLLFYPAVVLNACLIASTLFLGWHYLTDVIGGIGIAALTLWATEVLYEKYCVKNKVKITASKTTIKTIKPKATLVTTRRAT